MSFVSGEPRGRSVGRPTRSTDASSAGQAGCVHRVLVLDNYDSFVYNLVQYLGELGAEPLVYRHDAIDERRIRELSPDGILISPGPGRPEDAGISCGVIRSLGESVPVLGVCLGHQCIGAVF